MKRQWNYFFICWVCFLSLQWVYGTPSDTKQKKTRPHIQAPRKPSTTVSSHRQSNKTVTNRNTRIGKNNATKLLSKRPPKSRLIPSKKPPKELGDRSRPCPSQYKTEFLWDIADDPIRSDWFKVTELNEVTSNEERRDQQQADTNVNRIFYMIGGAAMQRRLQEMNPAHNLSHNQFEYPNPFNKEALEMLLNINESRVKTRRMAVFKNARISELGLIMNNDVICQAVRNGGANSSAIVSYLSYQKENIPKTKHYSQIITLANFAEGSWHFPMELLVSLAGVHPDLIANSKIHVKSLGEKKAWLSLVGVNESMIIEGIHGFVRGDTVYAPQMATYGRPTSSQLYWLSTVVKKQLNLNVITQNTSPVSPRRSIVLIQRKKGDNRALNHFEIIKITLIRLAHLLNYDFILHQDISNFNAQFGRFVNAAIVVAPHGAGSLFINFAPRDVCFIELISTNEPLCFARMAYLRGHNYFSVERTMKHPRTANLSKLAIALQACALCGNSSLHTDMQKKNQLDNVMLRLVNKDVGVISAS